MNLELRCLNAILRHEPRPAGPCRARTPAAIDAASADRFVYVGTYTGPGVPPDGREPSTARGIYVFRMRASDGHLTLVQVAPTDNPSYLALDPTLTHLYCANQNDLVDGVPAGRVSAYAVSATNGTLTFLNHLSQFPADPRHAPGAPERARVGRVRPHRVRRAPIGRGVRAGAGPKPGGVVPSAPCPSGKGRAPRCPLGTRLAQRSVPRRRATPSCGAMCPGTSSPSSHRSPPGDLVSCFGLVHSTSSASAQKRCSPPYRAAQSDEIPVERGALL
jgi:hypothetical protein